MNILRFDYQIWGKPSGEFGCWPAAISLLIYPAAIRDSSQLWSIPFWLADVKRGWRRDSCPSSVEVHRAHFDDPYHPISESPKLAKAMNFLMANICEHFKSHQLLDWIREVEHETVREFGNFRETWPVLVESSSPVTCYHDILTTSPIHSWGLLSRPSQFHHRCFVGH